MTDHMQSFLLSVHAPLRDALIMMTSSRRGIVFVVDEEMHLMGVLSDGDIRRALLTSPRIDAPVQSWINLNPTFATSVDEAQQILRQKPYLLAVPIVDDQRKVIQIAYHNPYTLHVEIYTREDDTPLKEAKGPNQKVVPFVAFIPARGGSKRIPRKNLQPIGEHSLVGWAVKTALEVKEIGFIFVSTDSPEIQKEVRRYGIEVPWLRPSHLSGDRVPTIQVMTEELSRITQELGINYEACVLLEPTAPLRTPSLVSEAIQQFIKEQPDSLVTVSKVPHIFHPEELLYKKGKWLYPYLEGQTMDGRKGRHHQQPVWVQNGLVYVTQRRIIENGQLYGKRVMAYEVPQDLLLDIDTYQDLEWARFRMQHNK